MYFSHELGDVIGVLPGADVAVVGFAAISEAGAEQPPLTPVNPGPVPHQHVRDVLSCLPLSFLRLGHDVTVGVASAPMVSPPSSIITLTASFRGTEPSCWAP